jgi:undecaprenyl-diphosphatase
MRTIVDSITRWDVLWLTVIFGLHGRRLVAYLMPRISWTANGYCYPLLAAALLALDRSAGRLFLTSAVVAFSVELPAYKLLKRCVKRDRPCETLPGVERRINPSDRFSFPSGHTAAAFLVATLLGNAYPYLFPIAGAWALVVGISRIYLGVHYPTDVAAGMLLGALSALCGIAVAE